jgi:hypothetical protein
MIEGLSRMALRGAVLEFWSVTPRVSIRVKQVVF